MAARTSVTTAPGPEGSGRSQQTVHPPGATKDRPGNFRSHGHHSQAPDRRGSGVAGPMADGLEMPNRPSLEEGQQPEQGPGGKAGEEEEGGSPQDSGEATATAATARAARAARAA
jgi:hypothetical protein